MSTQPIDCLEIHRVRVCWLVFRLSESGLWAGGKSPEFATYEDISRTSARFAFSRRVFLGEFCNTTEKSILIPTSNMIVVSCMVYAD